MALQGVSTGNSGLSSQPRQNFFERLRHDPLHIVRAGGAVSTAALAFTIDDLRRPPNRVPFTLRDPTVHGPNRTYEGALKELLLDKIGKYEEVARKALLSREHFEEAHALVEKQLRYGREIGKLEADLPLAKRYDAIDAFLKPRLKKIGFKLAPEKFLNRVAGAALLTGLTLSALDIATASRQDGRENGRSFGIGRRTWGAFGANLGLWTGTTVGALVGSCAGWPGIIIGSTALGSVLYPIAGTFFENVYDQTHRPGLGLSTANHWPSRVIKLDVSKRPPPLSEISS